MQFYGFAGQRVDKKVDINLFGSYTLDLVADILNGFY